jgi:hypothetical protein
MTIWRRMPFSWTVFAIVSAQSALLVFLVDCRTTALWQIMLIGCVGIGVAVAALVRRPVSGHSHRWTAAWPAVIAPILLVAHMAAIQKSADPRYATETKTHVIWHEVLSGILGASPELQRAYTGTEHGIDFLDSDPYAAVVRDINARNDRSSKIAIVHDGRIDLDASVDQNEYERLKRAMAFKIIRERPGAVGVGIYNKFVEQAESFARKDAMSPGNLAGAALLTALGTLVWLIAQGYPPPADQVRGGAAAGGIILLFSTAPVVIEPSSLSVGTLLSFLVALALGISTTIVLAVHRLREHATRLMWNSGHADG